MKELVTLTILDNGNLRIAIDDSAWVRGKVQHTKKAYKESLREIKVLHKENNDCQFGLYDILEYVLCNSEWDIVKPEEVGALTDSPLIANWTWRNGHDELKRCGHVYWYPNYMVSDPVEKLIENGYVDFDSDGEDEPPYPTEEEKEEEERRLYDDMLMALEN